MKKILVATLVAIFILSSFGAMANTDLEKSNTMIQTNSKYLSFSTLKIKQENVNYLSIEMKDVSTYLASSGKPMLPKIVETFELPFDAENIDLELEIKEIFEKQITKEVSPSSYMLPLTLEEGIADLQKKDLEVYSSDNPYPASWYSYDIYSGLNSDNKRAKFVVVDIYPVRYIPSDGRLLQAESADINIVYETSEEIIEECADPYDLVIISPSVFKPYLKKLVDHKNDDVGVKTFLKTTEEIYADPDYDGVDEPEDIKLFIKDAIDNHDISYVLLVGGLKNQIYAKPRDTANKGVKGWYLPVRYTNLYDQPKYPLKSGSTFDPGVISDLYYADVYDGENNFSSWNPNNDDYFAAWGKQGVEDDDDIDMAPDVSVGRLACRNIKEVKTVVDKIINYETTDIIDSDWFNRATVVSGDGFLDQQDLKFEWDTTGLENDHYTIYAQSINDEDEKGPIDTIPIEIDRSQETSITFNHDDHLNPALADGYPAPPITEIVTISPGDILGYDDYTYTPREGEAFCNDFNPWANISYVGGVLTIRGKSYDPKPYGNLTDVHVWIKDMKGETIYSDWRNNTEMYYEGEWTTGEKSLKGRGGALYYMPEKFERDIIWTSNGKFTGREDVINGINKGAGFLFFSGHGSPNVWADHYPGVPGNRGPASVTGLQVTQITIFNVGGLLIGQRPISNLIPPFPMDALSNGEKLPVAVVGGCHNSQFNVSMLPGFLEGFQYIGPNLHMFDKMYMWCHGAAVPECFNWRLVRNPNGGSIASIGNTGLGYGMPGKDLTTGGGDGWITIEFFRQYGEHGQTVLGNAHSQAITSYIQTHEMSDFESGHPKSVQQWALLGDPSLKLGGY